MDDIGELVYLGLLGLVVVGYFVSENRQSLGKTAQQAIIWVLIFVGMIAVVGMWDNIKGYVSPQQSNIATGVIEVPRQRDGHYYLTLTMNGKPVDFVIDTGASAVVLTRSDAQRIGINMDDLIFSGSASTANGVVKTAFARVKSVEIGDIKDRDISVSVNGGELDESLLGMTYLQRFEKIEISRGKMVLTR